MYENKKIKRIRSIYNEMWEMLLVWVSAWDDGYMKTLDEEWEDAIKDLEKGFNKN